MVGWQIGIGGVDQVGIPGSLGGCFHGDAGEGRAIVDGEQFNTDPRVGGVQRAVAGPPIEAGGAKPVCFRFVGKQVQVFARDFQAAQNDFFTVFQLAAHDTRNDDGDKLQRIAVGVAVMVGEVGLAEGDGHVFNGGYGNFGNDRGIIGIEYVDGEVLRVGPPKGVLDEQGDVVDAHIALGGPAG